MTYIPWAGKRDFIQDPAPFGTQISLRLDISKGDILRASHCKVLFSTINPSTVTDAKTLRHESILSSIFLSAYRHNVVPGPLKSYGNE